MAEHDKTTSIRVTGTATTGHEWDGIHELNTPLPRWWLWTLLRHHRLGDRLLDRLSGLAADLRLHHGPVRLALARRASRSSSPTLEKAARRQMAALAAASLADIENDPALARASPGRRRQAVLRRQLRAVPRRRRRAAPRAIPNLNDDDWLWGGTLDQIEQTIQSRRPLRPRQGA